MIKSIKMSNLEKYSTKKLIEILKKTLESYGDEFFNEESNEYYYVTTKIDNTAQGITVMVKTLTGELIQKFCNELYYPNYQCHVDMENITLQDLMEDVSMEDE